MTKCRNNDCPLKEKCKRFVAVIISHKKEQKFDFKTNLNPDGSFKYHSCEFQITI